MRASGHAYRMLGAADIQRIHRSALEILERMGMEVQSRRLLALLEARGARVDYDMERVTFPRPFVERFLADAPKRDDRDPSLDSEAHRVYGSAGVYESLYHDPESGDLLPWTEDRMALYFALARELPRVAGASMLGCRLPVPAPLVPLYERYYCWKYGASEAGTILSDRVCPYLLALYEARAADLGASLQDVFRASVYLIPSLKLGRHEAYQVAFFRDRGLRVHIGHSMATMGATAPVTLAGAVTLNLAEHLALSILNWALFDQRSLHLGCSLAPMDMRTAIRPFGRPEMALANLMTAQLARHYGASFSGHAGLTDAKLPSVEAGAQKVLSAVPTLMVGGSLWMDVGLLAADEVCSPVQMVLDSELLGALSRFAGEVRVDAETIGLETILAAGPGGQYLDRMHTARHFREEVWNPDLWSQEMLKSWLVGDRVLDADRAREWVLRVRSELDSETRLSFMPESFEREVLEVIDRARRSLMDGSSR